MPDITLEGAVYRVAYRSAKYAETQVFCRFCINHIRLLISRIIKLFPTIFREFSNSFRLT
jgi:Na+-transporting NADH:ubiquinone oxidoreductase subunit NqrB